MVDKTIAFTSCMNAERCPKQPVWDQIMRANAGKSPDILLLLGDQIYMDWGLASLADVPRPRRRWLDASTKKREKLLQAFAAEMHWRYALQWAVPEFRKLVCSMGDRNNVVLAWDDHDFAWNNAVGIECDPHANPKERNDKVVPEPFKRIAWALRQMFETVLRTATADSYPVLPALPDLLDAALPVAVPPQRRDLGDIPVMVLDQRWSRTHRDAEPAAALLSNDDRQELKEAVSAEKGLLILAGSSPIKHRSLSGGHSSWWAEPDPEKTGGWNSRAYPEYDILKAARRPVLYLAGEIHRNAWGGYAVRVDRRDPQPPVVQVLSSGAALGRLLFHKYPGSFGIVHVVGSAQKAEVQIDLHALDVHDETRSTVEGHHISVVDGQIAGDVDQGECADGHLLDDADRHMLAVLDPDWPLPVLAYRVLGSAFSGDDAPLLLPDEIDTKGVSDLLPTVGGEPAGREDLAFMADGPTALMASGEGAGVRLRRLIGANGPALVQQAVQAAFTNAAKHGRSVVLFVHGFGKGMSAALTQAAELRVRFNCEVVLYTWPTGGGEGLFGALAALDAAERAANLSGKGLSSAMGTFCAVAGEPRYKQVPAVLLARSLGVQALVSLQGKLDGPDTQNLARVVLSAPACTVTDFKWVRELPGKVVVTVNQQDRTLRLADIFHKGQLLGRQAVKPLERPETVYLDCTQVNGVGGAHDYLLRSLYKPLNELNERLVTGKPIPFKEHGVPGLVAYVDGKPYPAP